MANSKPHTPAFGVDRDRLVEGLQALSKRVCGYMRQPCDCKYGIREQRESEKSGCPEAALAAHLISMLTKREYDRLIKKAKVSVWKGETI